MSTKISRADLSVTTVENLGFADTDRQGHIISTVLCRLLPERAHGSTV